MKRKIILFISAICVFAAVFSGCSKGDPAAENTISETISETEENVSETENKVASGNETVPVQAVDTANLTPIYGKDIKDGTYKIDVHSSSSMFKIKDCELTVSKGKMTAVMTMSGKGYLQLFMGKG